MEIWRILPYGEATARENMALDEALFRAAQCGEAPATLRFYGWSGPAVSLGRFQDPAAEIDVGACLRRGIEVVRRPTGGKAVLHGRDLSYAVVGRAEDPRFSADVLTTHRSVSACLAGGLGRLGLAAELAPAGRVPGGVRPEGACFARPSPYELLVGGRKICGSAQVRARGVFLQHGALLKDFDAELAAHVLFPAGTDREGIAGRLRRGVTSLASEGIPPRPVKDLCRVFAEAFAGIWGVRFVEGFLDETETQWQRRLLREKYGRESWKGEGGPPPPEGPAGTTDGDRAPDQG